MGYLTKGQQTVQQLLDQLQRRQGGSTQQNHQVDLSHLCGILERALEDSEHPVNAVMMQVRAWGFEDGEVLFQEADLTAL